jgi:hypothetical protein
VEILPEDGPIPGPSRIFFRNSDAFEILEIGIESRREQYPFSAVGIEDGWNEVSGRDPVRA